MFNFLDVKFNVKQQVEVARDSKGMKPLKEIPVDFPIPADGDGKMPVSLPYLFIFTYRALSFRFVLACPSHTVLSVCSS